MDKNYNQINTYVEDVIFENNKINASRLQKGYNLNNKTTQMEKLLYDLQKKDQNFKKESQTTLSIALPQQN